MTARSRVVAIFAHPDDESLVAGGTLAACAAQGIEVILICITRGENGPISDCALATRDTLGSVREAELRAAADTLGVHTVECLDYPDGMLRWADAARITEDLSARLRTWRPQAVITFGPEGLYWHKDHIAVQQYTQAAWQQVSNEGWCSELYYATWPAELALDLTSAMASRELCTDLWGLPPGAFGVPREILTTIIDVRQFVRPKLCALRRHRTQLPPDHLLMALPQDLAETYLGREYFIWASAADNRQDWLHNSLRQQRFSKKF